MFTRRNRVEGDEQRVGRTATFQFDIVRFRRADKPIDTGDNLWLDGLRIRQVFELFTEFHHCKR